MEFRKVVGIEPPRSFDSLLEKAMAYMDYEKRVGANKSRDPRKHGPTNAL